MISGNETEKPHLLPKWPKVHTTCVTSPETCLKLSLPPFAETNFQKQDMYHVLPGETHGSLIFDDWWLMANLLCSWLLSGHLFNPVPFMCSNVITIYSKNHQTFLLCLGMWHEAQFIVTKNVMICRTKFYSWKCDDLWEKNLG